MSATVLYRAIVAGRGTFEPAGGWSGDHHDGAWQQAWLFIEPDLAALT